MSSSGVSAQGEADPESTPTFIFKATPVPLDVGINAVPESMLAPSFADKVSIGLNFESTRNGVDSGYVPPDTMGAVGPNHIVELINGNFEVFDKNTGNSLLSNSLDWFWRNHVNVDETACRDPLSDTFDPRIIYDTASERFFAISIDRKVVDDDDNVIATNFFYIGRSDTDNPLGDWDGLCFPADTVNNPEFHDYPTLGLDADGVYFCTQDFGDVVGHESCYSIPKADLLQAVPTVANMSRFEDTGGLPAVSGSIQPAVDFEPTDGRAALLGVAGGALVRSNIFGAQTSTAFLDTPVGITGDPGHGDAPAARQPDSDTTIENVAPRFVGNVMEQGDSLWAVHSVAGSGSNAALRWYEINEITNTVIQTGLIEDVNRDFHEPSIAVNKRGDIVIGYSCSGPNLYVSTCVSIGETDSGGTTTFIAPQILATGNGNIRTGDDRNRWGDYSATVLDPVDPCTFWTLQEYVAIGANVDVAPPGPGDPPVPPAVNGGTYGIQLTELTINQCVADQPPADVIVNKVCKPDGDYAIGSNAPSPYCEITVQNFGPGIARDVELVDQIWSDGNVTVTGIVSDGLENCEANPAGPASAITVSCDPIAALAKNGVATLKVTFTADSAVDVNDRATATTSTEDPNPNNNSDEGTVHFIELADLSITKLCKPDRALLAGEVGTCTLYVDNNGPSPARDVVISDANVSDGTFDILSATLDVAGSCLIGSPSAGVVTCTLTNPLPASSATDTGRAVVVIELTSDEGVDINDVASVTSNTADPDHSNNQAEGSIVVDAVADLALEKTDSPDPVYAGNQLTYDLTVTNNGPSTAVNVLIEDAVPAGVSIDSVSALGGSCNAGVPGDSNQPTTCTFDSMSSGSSEMMTVVVTVLPGTTGILHNDARVSSDTLDTDNSNNLASTDTFVDAEAALEVSKSDSPDPVAAGELLSYTIDVTNNGPSTAVDVLLSDTLPAEGAFVSATADNGSICVWVQPDTVNCELGNLDPGQHVTVYIDILIDASVPDGTVITNDVDVTSPSDPDGASASEGTTVIAVADLWIDKTGNFPTGSASGTILYFLTVHNTSGCSEDDPQVCGDGGPSDALDIVVTDTLPSTSKKLIVEFVSENCSYTKGTHSVSCNEPVLAAGDSVTFEIQVNAKGNLGEITNLVDVSSSTTDPDTGNNSDALLMTVQGGTGDSGGPGGGRGRGGGPK